jgi:hypothetical protein
MKKIVYLFPLLVFLQIGCYYDNAEELAIPETCSKDTTNSSIVISFSQDILPIFNSETGCGGLQSGCHGDNNQTGLSLNNYTSVSNELNDNPGRLLSSIKHDDPNVSNMPKGGGKLSDCKINLITAWINRGALNN